MRFSVKNPSPSLYKAICCALFIGDQAKDIDFKIRRSGEFFSERDFFVGNGKYHGPIFPVKSGEKKF
jgi:hypothetical protein